MATFENQYKTKYIEEQINQLDSLVNYAFRFATFDVIVLSFTLSYIPFGNAGFTLTNYGRFLLSTAMGFFLVSAISFALFTLFMVQNRIQAIDLLYTLDIEKARSIHFPGNGFFRKWGWLTYIGVITMIIGIIEYMILLVWVILYI
jgi:hypothetical protein